MVDWLHENDTLDYAIWANRTGEPYAEAAPRSAIVARFMFMQEALDYQDYLEPRKCKSVIRGPYGYRSVRGGKILDESPIK